jgi:hypothetical protein
MILMLYAILALLCHTCTRAGKTIENDGYEPPRHRFRKLTNNPETLNHLSSVLADS